MYIQLINKYLYIIRVLRISRRVAATRCDRPRISELVRRTLSQDWLPARVAPTTYSYNRLSFLRFLLITLFPLNIYDMFTVPCCCLSCCLLPAL